ncbi:MFS transporter [Pseudonocardia sp. Cha107L01]|uniref:MFS transporter n=1 Tax=Pseudonocardia sp. Cha107L01 TaxID=3457576 RepID=UPI00403EE0C6
MPAVVYVLGLGIFAMTTSEFMVSGMLPELASALNVSISAIGYLVSAYAIAMALGGPFVSAALTRLSHGRALVLLLGAFLAGQVLGALATGYPMLVVSRVITGCAEAAFFGVGLTVAMDTVPPRLAGRAASVVLGGLMVSSVLGLPLATFLAQWAGWRGAFWAVAGLVLVAGVAVLVTVRRPVVGRVGAAVRAGTDAGADADAVSGAGARAAADGSAGGLRAELALFRNRRLWAVYGTSMLHIGALFAAFSFFAAIFIDVTGFAPGLVPVLLTGYGAAAVIGNMVVGRLADRYPMAVLTLGLAALVGLLAGFAAGAAVPAVVLVTVIGIGMVGLPLNSATIARRMRVVANTPMINTVGASVVNVGIAVGPTLGGLAISAGLGLRAPLWIGAALAGLALLSLLPYLRPATHHIHTRAAQPADSVCTAS